jgi:hypothetical protein
VPWILLLVVGQLVSVVRADAPFSPIHLPQPVSGAPRAATANGWLAGKLCEVGR